MMLVGSIFLAYLSVASLLRLYGEKLYDSASQKHNTHSTEESISQVTQNALIESY